MTEPLTRKWLTEEIKFFLMLGTLLVGVCGSWFMQSNKISLIKQDLGYIKTNHITHMESDLKTLREDVSNIDKNLAVIATVLEGLEFTNL